MLRPRTWLLPALVLFACAGMQSTLAPLVERPAESAEVAEVLEVVSADVEVEPEPVGGSAAIQAALQEPEEVWKENRSGTVTVQITIDKDGRVVEARVVESSGYPAMDAEAMLALSRVAWNPARRNGEPTWSVALVSVPFGVK